ncbi:methionyl-tRNA formyltransferase [Lindgomyces ingoldianus]|uniref:Methionyl-tRNA formyltransferase n=1 Tax=Lindgomyces ingoldianus TaxID=673940 RepID=A0ACB6QXI8_9PLEO|nr:methionyl-tRNA formyltransferase [Lindgomyces ingoldianus]KAF2471596.1 methionyl-tRNA formyltransferase [Lindgomyces ingoldianus]
MMLWRLPSPVRPFSGLNCRPYSSTKHVEPLRILFCGSDQFSIASLSKLNKAKNKDPLLIESIDVVHRPGKRTGRGLKTIKDVPIKRAATLDFKLPTHVRDTFTNWEPPVAYNLIIAVSFGLLIPSRILDGAKYGGLNVHPSLLPDLRGPAPIHHTLLKRRKYTGITIQTLHPTHFDHGTILSQTPAPGIEVCPGATPVELVDKLGSLGGSMLLDVIRRRDFFPPVHDVGWYAKSGGPVDNAEKITSEHRYVNFSTTTAGDIQDRHRLLGNLWCTLLNGKRLILHDVCPYHGEDSTRLDPGLFVGETGDLLARTQDGKLVHIVESTVEGRKTGSGKGYLRYRPFLVLPTNTVEERQSE